MGKKKHGKRKSGQRISRRKEALGTDVSTESRGGNRQKARGAAVGASEKLSIWPSLLAALLIFLISTPAIVGPYGQGIGYMPDLHMSAYIQVGAMVLLSLFLLSTFVRKRMRIIVPSSPLLLPLLLFYGWATLSVLWADTKYEAVGDALDWTGAFLCGLLIVLLLRELKLLRLLLLFLTVSGLLMALLAIGQFLFGIDWVHQHIVPAATFSNKNMAGQYGVLIFPLAVTFFLVSKDRLRIWFFAITTSLIMVYVFYTRSRGALVGLLTEIIILSGLLVYFRFKHGYHFFGDTPVKKVALAVSLALFVGMSSVTPSMLGNTEKVVAASLGEKPPALRDEHGGRLLARVLGYEDTASTRFTMWKNSIPMFKDHFLIGVGLGNWTVHYATYQGRLAPDMYLMNNQYHANAHNDYVEVLCELGIIGFALFIWVIVSFFRVAGRLLSDRNEECFLLTLPIATAIMGIGINAVFSFPLKQPVPILMVFVYLAVLSNLHGAFFKGGKERVFSLPPAPVRGVATAFAVFAALGLFELQRNWYHSEHHYHNAVISLGNGDYQNALIEAERSYGFNPMRMNLLWLQATSLLQLGREKSYQEAVEMLEKVTQAYPYSANTLLNLSAGYRAVGKQENAIENLAQLASVQPINMPLKNKDASFLFSVGKFEEALKRLEVYSRNWQYASEQVAARLKSLKSSANPSPSLVKAGENLLEEKRVRLAQIARDIEKAKRNIKQRNTSLRKAPSEDPERSS